ncbi:MAG: hypothetical protein ACI3VQ_04740 [Faecousia sp.]
MGIQYFPADSIQTSVQLFSESQDAQHRKSLVKVEHRFFLYVVTPFSSVVAMQATAKLLWTSIPQQIG